MQKIEYGFGDLYLDLKVFWSETRSPCILRSEMGRTDASDEMRSSEEEDIVDGPRTQATEDRLLEL